MTASSWTYPPDLIEVLVTFGLKPTPATPPVLVRDALNDLYRYEIRRLRQRMVDGKVEKARYADEVVALRKRYWPLSLQTDHWEIICRQASPSITNNQ